MVCMRVSRLRICDVLVMKEGGAAADGVCQKTNVWCDGCGVVKRCGLFEWFVGGLG